MTEFPIDASVYKMLRAEDITDTSVRVLSEVIVCVRLSIGKSIVGGSSNKLYVCDELTTKSTLLDLWTVVTNALASLKWVVFRCKVSVKLYLTVSTAKRIWLGRNISNCIYGFRHTNKKQRIEAGSGDKIYSLASAGLKTSSSYIAIFRAITASLSHYLPNLEWKTKGASRRKCPFLVRKSSVWWKEEWPHEGIKSFFCQAKQESNEFMPYYE